MQKFGTCEFTVNDLVTFTFRAKNTPEEDEYTVILDERHDNNRTSDISWWAYTYPEKGKRFALPERELFPIN